MLAQVRQAVRSLLRTPGFTAAALATLALGIGANTALFSVVRAVLLDPLPYGEPSRAVLVWSRWTDFDQTWVSYDEYELLRDETRSLDGVGLFMDYRATLGGEEPVQVRGVAVTREVAPVLRVEPALGRWFTPEEDAPGGANVVVLSWGLWQRRYGGDPAVVGRQLEVNGTLQTVVGVMPAGFRLPLDYGAAGPSEVYAPFGITAADYGAIPGPEMQSNGGSHTFYAVARLAPGSTVASLNAELASLIRPRVGTAYPEGWHFGMFGVSLPDQISGPLRGALLVLLAGVGLVLLIACGNVAGLFLVRTERRHHEIAIRGALGAPASRIAGQFLTESVVVALAGGVLGVVLAVFAVEGVRALAPATLPRIDGASVDGAGLTVRSVGRLMAIEPGFDPDGVLTARLALPSSYYADGTAVTTALDGVRRRLATLPGVTAVGFARLLPLASDIGTWGMTVEGYTPPPGEGTPGEWQVVTPGYTHAPRRRWRQPGSRGNATRGAHRLPPSPSPPAVQARRRGLPRVATGRRMPAYAGRPPSRGGGTCHARGRSPALQQA